MKDKQCTWCKGDFDAFTNNQMYCSKYCARASQKQRDLLSGRTEIKEKEKIKLKKLKKIKKQMANSRKPSNKQQMEDKLNLLTDNEILAKDAKKTAKKFEKYESKLTQNKQKYRFVGDRISGTFYGEDKISNIQKKYGETVKIFPINE